MKNPFELVTASKLTAEQAIELWCDDKRLERVWGKENCFINGHRGTGKSMLFRILQYDCQRLLHPENEPDFLGICFSVRDSELMTEELDLFQDNSQISILSESHLSILIIKQLFLILQANKSLIKDSIFDDFCSLVVKNISAAYQFSTPEAPNIRTSQDSFYSDIIDLFENERLRIVHYIALSLYEHTRYDGPLFLFDMFLSPIANFLLNSIKKTLYILIDDGDDLPLSYTVILNTWIARRCTAIVFKVSTMFGYKTYKTKGRSAIQHPHDFIQYDIATRYLSDNSEDYIQLLSDITEKRLKAIGVDTNAELFFPEDEQQKRAIETLGKDLLREYSGKYSGRSINDYVYRHLTSEYLKRNLKPGRSTFNYIYSGFKVIAGLSSGMVRDYIICAQRMFDDTCRITKIPGSIPSQIPPQIQNDVVRKHADDILEEISIYNQKRCTTSTREDWQNIKRIIEGLCKIFKTKMLSTDSERRVFSFSFQDEPTDEIERLLNLAISEGYLMKGYISRKEGSGRRVLYVLTRRLAPAYNLDVMSYAGYLSLTSERISNLMHSGYSAKIDLSTDQLPLFSSMEYLDSIPDEESPKEEWIRISPEEAGL
jgi:hypothetical protein